MNILVTGGAGLLLAQGHSVLVLDDFSTGSRSNLPRSRKSLGVKKGSILDTKSLGPLVKDCDLIFHLAAVVGVKLAFSRPITSLNTNIDGTRNVLQLATLYGKKVVFTSSSEVYGNGGSRKRLKETDTLSLGSPGTSLRWGYGASKLAGEFLALGHHKHCGLPVVVTRLFNTVGPRQSSAYGMVLPTFVDQALAGSPITVYGTGKQERSFTCVSEVAQAIYQLALEEKAVGGIYNIASCNKTSILELAQTVKDVTGSASEIVFVPYEEAYGKGFADIVSRSANVVKLHSLLKWAPSIGLEDIIRRIIRWRSCS